jgi:hypothetical protein
MDKQSRDNGDRHGNRVRNLEKRSYGLFMGNWIRGCDNTFHSDVGVARATLGTRAFREPDQWLDKGKIAVGRKKIFQRQTAISMLDLINSFSDYEKKISDYIRGCISNYRGSECYKLLDRRMNDLRMSADLKPASLRRNEYISHVVFPLVKEQSLINSAVCAANYRAQDIFNLTAGGNTPPENSFHAEMVLNLNMANSFFKMKALKPAIVNAALYGTSVMYTYWADDERPKMGTMYDPTTGQYKRVMMPNQRKNSLNKMVDLRDYFQAPECPEPEESPFQGHSRRAQISDLVKLLDNEAYITENLGSIIEKAKDGIMPKNNRSSNEQPDSRKPGRFEVEIDRFEGVLPIKGNEEDDTRYCAEMIGETIIRLSVDDYDDEISSYTVLNFQKRPEYWWGNSDCEYKLPHENFLNVMLSMTADNALKSMQQYVFYNGKSISMDDISNRDAMGGFISVDAKSQPLQNLLFPYQPGAMNYNAVEYAVNAVNESSQKMGTRVDFSKQNNGGMINNKTATAAQIVAGQGDVLEADKLENFNFSVCDIGRKNLILLQQFLSELFYVRPKKTSEEQMLYKYMILGRFQYSVNSTLDKNKQNEMVRLQNLVTWLSNLLVNPQLQQAGYRLIPAVNDVIRRADLPSIDEILPDENMPQPQLMPPQGAAPGRPPQGQPGNAAPPGPPQAPQQSPLALASINNMVGGR